MSDPLPNPEAAATDISVPDAAVGPRLYGVIDVVRPERIAGWVIDRNDSRAAVDVEIRREGRLVATLRADRHRKDLERGGVGTGRYGFAGPIDPPLEAGFEFTVTATARAPDGASTVLRPARAGTASPELRLMERVFEEVTRLDTARPAENTERLAEVIGRIEVVQARLEAALAAVEPPPPPAQSGLAILAGLALAAGLGSLVLGLLSMLFF